MVKIPVFALSELVKIVGGTLVRGNLDSGIEVSLLSEPSEADANSVTFLITDSFQKDLEGSKADVLICQKSIYSKLAGTLPQTLRACILTDDAYAGLAKLSHEVVRRSPDLDWEFSSSEADAPDVHPEAQVDPTAVVSPGAKIGAGTVVLARAVIGPNVTLGEGCLIFPGVVLYPRTVVGNRVRLHANAVIGSDGFGYARTAVGAIKIWHLGRVVIGDDVEIGAGSTVDRGTIRDTLIESGAKIDNQVQIGHNGHVKSHAVLCSQVGLSGNVTVGKGAILAGKAGIADKVEIGDGSVVGAMTGVSKDVKSGEVVMGGFPCKTRRDWWRMLAFIDRLPDLFDKVKRLERAVDSNAEAVNRNVKESPL